MRIRALWVAMFFIVPAAALAQETAPPRIVNGSTDAAAKAASVESELGVKLLTIRRIYVDGFGDDPVSRQMQAMVIASLSESKRFIITENKDRADAVLRGTGLEKTSQELHSYDDATSAGQVSGFANRHVAVVGGAAAAINDSSTNTETIDRARLAVRLVDKDGDVVWSTMQESQGAKYKGASADVAEKVAKQLLHDLEKEERKQAVPPTEAKQE